MITPVDVVKIHSLLKNNGVLHTPSVAVAGFSSKGIQVALYARKAGFKVVAVSDESCGIVDLGGNGGLDILQIIKLRNKYKFLKNIELKNVRKTRSDFLPRIEVDVLIIEGLEKKLADEVRAKVVFMMEKKMISKEVLDILKVKQIPIISS